MSARLKMAALPALLAVLALAAWQAGLVFADDPGEGEPSHEHAGYPAPAVTLADYTVCSDHTSRALVMGPFHAVGASGGYEQQIAWSHDPGLSGDDIPWGPVRRYKRSGPGPWALSVWEPDIARGHSYRLRALDGGGNHGPWGEATYVHMAGDAAAPASLTVSAVGRDYSKAMLRWRDGGDGATDGFRFRIQHRASGAVGWQDEGWVRVEKRVRGDDAAYQHLLTGLDPSASHDFRVAAHTKECAPTGWSEQVSLSPPAPPAPPPAPDFTLSVSYGAVEASLVATPQNPPAGVRSYTLRYRIKGSGDEYTEVTATAASAAWGITVSGLSYGGTYQVGLRAANAVGEGAYADREVTVSALPDPPGFTVSAGYRKGRASLLVDLAGDVAGATGYVVKVDGISTTHSPGAFDEDGVSVPARTGATHSVSIATVSAVGRGEFSAVQSFTTLSPPSLPSAAAEVRYSGDSASVVVTVSDAPADEQLQGYLVRHRRVSAQGAGWTSVFITPARAQSGRSFSVERGASYAVRVWGLNRAGRGPGAALEVTVGARPEALDFTAKAVYSAGAATVLVKVKPGDSGVPGYWVRYRELWTGSWTVSSVPAAQARAGWSFPAEPGGSYIVEVAARTGADLSGYGTASVPVVPRVEVPEFTVVFTRSLEGTSARVAVSDPQPQARYHVFRVSGDAPVGFVTPDTEHDFAVVPGTAYRFGVAAGNEFGTGEYAHRDVTAPLGPYAPFFTLVPVYHEGEPRLAVRIAGPQAAYYLLKAGDGAAVRHTGPADLHLPVTPGESYTVSLAAGESAFTSVTRGTTVAEFEALLEWRLIPPGQPLPGGVVGDPTRYVSIVNGEPVAYDSVGLCMGRETAGAEADWRRALALYSWVSGTPGAPAVLTVYALSHRDAMVSALAAAEVAARTACEARHPGVENLGLGDARWVRVPR